MKLNKTITLFIASAVLMGNVPVALASTGEDEASASTESFNDSISGDLPGEASTGDKSSSVANEISTVMIEATNQTLELDSEFDPLADVTATRDGEDITSEIEVTANNVDTSTAGTYQVIYGIKNDTSVEKKITIVVADATETIENTNTVMIEAIDQTLELDSEFDPLADVTATRDGEDISTEIEVTANNVDTSTTGTYQVTYSLKGDTSVEKTINVIVEDTTSATKITSSHKASQMTQANDEDPVEVTTITPDTYMLGNRQVTGTASEAVKYVKIEINKTLSSARATVSSDHAFSYYVGTKGISKDDSVLIVAYGANDTELGSQEVIVEKPSTEGTLTLDQSYYYYFGNDRFLTGSYEGNIHSIALEIDGEKQKSITVGSSNENTFSYYVGTSTITSKDQVVAVVGYDIYGDELSRAELMIDDYPPQDEGTIDSLTPYTLPDDRRITGTVSGAVSFVRIQVNDEIYRGIARVTADGTFSYYSGTLITSDDDLVYVIACDVYGRELVRQQLEINQYPPLLEGSIDEINAFDLSTDSRITGTYSGEVAFVKLEVNGAEISGWAEVSTDGTFSYYAGKTIKDVYDNVDLVAYDRYNQELDRKAVSIQKSITQGKITNLQTYYLHQDRKIIGSYTGDVKKIMLQINGEIIPSTGMVYSEGGFYYYAGSEIQNVTDEVYVIAYDHNDQELERQLLTIEGAPKEGAITPSAYQFYLERKITGTYTGDVKTIKATVNGEELASNGIVSSNGTFSYYIGSAVTDIEAEIYLTAYDVYGRELDRQLVTISSVKGGLTTVQDYVLYDQRTIEGTFSGEVKKVRLVVNDELLGAVGILNEEGHFYYYAGSEITSLKDKIFIVGYDQEDNELNRLQVQIVQTEQVGSISVNPYNLSYPERTIAGVYSGDITKVLLEVNGVILSNAGTVVRIGDCIFSYYAGSAIKSTDDKAFLIALDRYGNQLDKVSVSILKD